MNKAFLKMLKRKIDSVELVSFDIFDTLIKRNCPNPSYIFRIVERIYNASNNDNLNFYEMRITAEKKAREKSLNGEVTLDDIYKNINVSNKISEKLKKIEIQMEYEFCQVNHDMYEVYQYCLKKHKKVIAISNMYLPQIVLKRILSNARYDIDDIYVSCEYNVSKQKGKLFNRVYANYNISKDKILHIGDGLKADYLGAKYAGVKSYRINRNDNNLMLYNYNKIINSDSSDTLKTIFSVINNNNYIATDYYSKLGFELVGPVCLQFVNWVHEVSLNSQIDNILFCARDMKLISDIYKLLYKNQDSHYFYVSRRSTYLPYLYKKNNYHHFRELLPIQKKNTSIEEVLNILNVDFDFSSLLDKYNLNISKKYDRLEDIFNDKNFEEFYTKELVKYIKNTSEEQYDNFNKYLKSLNISRKTAIVDLGWRGSTQKILMQILNYDIKGLYFGLIGKHKEIEKNYYTFLFDEKNNKYSEKVFPAEEIIELMFSSLDGTTIGYRDNINEPYILKESLNASNSDIQRIQTGAMEFIKVFSKYNQLFPNIEDSIFIDKLLNITSNPTLKQAKMLGDLYSEDYKIKYIAKPNKRLYYIFHVKQLIRDFAESSWKVGFLKRFFVIKLPYFLIFKIIKRLKYGNS